MNDICTCTPCRTCKGSGVIYFSFSGEYLGRHRLDDMDEMETCEECGGDGIEDICDHCRARQEEAEEAERNAEFKIDRSAKE